jgi:DNA-binding FadR family transcriptional regulator
MVNLVFGKFSRDSLASKVAGRITELIKDQQLQPGDRLPPERILAELMGVSRPIIRSAMKMLSKQNVVEIRNKKGTYVV